MVIPLTAYVRVGYLAESTDVDLGVFARGQPVVGRFRMCRDCGDDGSIEAEASPAGCNVRFGPWYSIREMEVSNVSVELAAGHQPAGRHQERVRLLIRDEKPIDVVMHYTILPAVYWTPQVVQIGPKADATVRLVSRDNSDSFSVKDVKTSLHVCECTVDHDEIRVSYLPRGGVSATMSDVVTVTYVLAKTGQVEEIHIPVVAKCTGNGER